jgi:hypothetical protein
MTDSRQSPEPLDSSRPPGPPQARRAARRRRQAQRQVVPPFHPRQLQRDLRLDAILQAPGWVFGAVCWLWIVTIGTMDSFVPLLSILGLLPLIWVNQGVVRALPHLDQMLQENLGVAEAQLARLLRCRALSRQTRLVLYHRLTLLRHRQGRMDEAAALVSAILSCPGSTVRLMGIHRPGLLLMNAQLALDRGDPYTAYAALVELHSCPLDIAWALQRLVLQTRYELLVGATAATLTGLRHKVRWAELMPAPMCGFMHALLAEAARRDESADPQAALWLQRRAALLCEPRVRRTMP